MDVRPGYKLTEVGVVPEEWEVKSLGDVASVTAGGTPSRSVAKYWNGDIPWITTSEIDFGTINRAEQFISKDGLKNSAARMLPTGTLLMALYGQGKTRGKVGVLGLEAATNQACAAINLDRGVSSSFMLHFLASRYDAIRNLSNTGNQENLNGSLVRSIRILLPPRAEQELIADALNDADALIESLEQVLAKKRQLKQSAMEALLTGKKRLPSFRGSWSTHELGEMIEHCSSGATPYRGRPQYYKGTINWITSGELNYNRITDTIEHISKEAVYETNLTVHPPGTFLVAITGLEAEGTRGACAIVGSPAATNQSCMAIYPSAGLRTDFLYQYYLLRGKGLALRYCQGTKQQSYTATLIRLLPIDLPPTTTEQAAIAALLSDMDSDIDELEAKLAKTRALAQGMRHELLTGRIRLA